MKKTKQILMEEDEPSQEAITKAAKKVKGMRSGKPVRVKKAKTDPSRNYAQEALKTGAKKAKARIAASHAKPDRAKPSTERVYTSTEITQAKRDATKKRVGRGESSRRISNKEATILIRAREMTEYQRIGAVLAEAMGYRVDELAFLAPLGAAALAAGRTAAMAAKGIGSAAVRGGAAAARGVGSAARAGATKAGQLGRAGAKKAGELGKAGVDAAGNAVKDKAVDMATEKVLDKAKKKLTGAVEEAKITKSRRVQAGPEGVAIGDDKAKKKAELTAQAASDKDLEEGKIMNKYVKKLMEWKAGPTAKRIANKHPKGASRRMSTTKGEKISRDPVVDRETRKTQKNVDRKLGVKTNLKVKDAVQGSMNRRRARLKKGKSVEGSPPIPPETRKQARAGGEADRKKVSDAGDK